MIYIVIIIAVILIMPIRIVAVRDDVRGDVDIYFTKIFNLRLDFDQLVRRLFAERGDPERITVKSALASLSYYRQARNIIRTATRMIKIKKLTLIVKTKSGSLDTDTWGFLFSYIGLSYLRAYIHRNFRAVENEYFGHQVAAVNCVNFECHFNVRLAYFLFALIRNIKDIPRVIKSMKKGKSVYGASNI